MKPKILLIISTIASVLFIGSLAYAGGMGGGMMGGGMGGGHMMDFGKGYSTPYPDQFNRYNRYDEPYQYGPGETKRLRMEIREKRKELSELYREEKPDRALIEKKVNELDKLEAELDHRLSEREYQRR